MAFIAALKIWALNQFPVYLSCTIAAVWLPNLANDLLLLSPYLHYDAAKLLVGPIAVLPILIIKHAHVGGENFWHMYCFR